MDNIHKQTKPNKNKEQSWSAMYQVLADAQLQAEDQAFEGLPRS